MELFGIDVSSLQGNIQWNKLDCNKVDFIIVRSSFGQNGIDSKFEYNMKNIKKFEFNSGVYHHSYARDSSEAICEARHFLNVIRPFKFQFPVCLCLEDSIIKQIKKTSVTKIIKTFFQIISYEGYYFMIQCPKSWIKDYIDIKNLTNIDIWLINHGEVPDYNKNFGIWQKSDNAIIDGISAPVNLNVAFWDYPTLISQNGLNRLNGSGVTPIFPQPSPRCKNHTVRTNETLKTIAKSYLSSESRWKEIAILNHLSSTILVPDQNLKIPEKSTIENKNTYTVTDQDTLWSIAKTQLGNGSRYCDIMKINHLRNDMIFPGQLLYLPTDKNQ